jgi:hypothetical protein
VHQSITLNVPYDLPDDDWKKIVTVFKSMDGWLESQNCQFWYGTEKDARYIYASVEPSGLLIAGEIDSMLWTGWITVLCAKLTLALVREIHDAEM